MRSHLLSRLDMRPGRGPRVNVQKRATVSRVVSYQMSMVSILREQNVV